MLTQLFFRRSVKWVLKSVSVALFSLCLSAQAATVKQDTTTSRVDDTQPRVQMALDVAQALSMYPVRVMSDKRGVYLLLPADKVFTSTTDVTVKRSYYRVFAAVLKVLKDYDNPLEVIAYTDDVVGQPDRTQLTERRARAIADFLVARGVAPKRIIKVHGQGARSAVASNRTSKGRSANRRIEVVLLIKNA